MASSPEFVAYCCELLSTLGEIEAKRMFGGYGLMVEGRMVGLIAFETLYLKTTAQTRPQFEAVGCEPFRYDKKTGETVSMSYFTPPAEALESRRAMEPWARLAREAAFAAKTQARKRVVKP